MAPTHIIETSNPEIQIDILMEQVTQRLAARGAFPDASMADGEAFSDVAWLMKRVRERGAVLRRQENPDTVYRLSDFAGLENDDFLRKAYNLILGRDPDGGGLAFYGEHLALGRFSKVETLFYLRYSQEGRRRGVRIAHLRLAWLLARVRRLPLMRKLINKLVRGRLPLF